MRIRQPMKLEPTIVVAGTYAQGRSYIRARGLDSLRTRIVTSYIDALKAAAGRELDPGDVAFVGTWEELHEAVKISRFLEGRMK